MLIKVKVFAGARNEEVYEDSGRLYVHVREPAKQNLANKRVRELVATHFCVSLGQVSLTAGGHSPSKTFEIREV